MKSAIARGTFLLAFAALLLTTVNETSEAKKKVIPAGETLFKQSCASCHPGGGNLHSSKKTIVDSKKLASIATFKSYLELPPGHMPHYKHIVGDPQALKALYDYCKSLQRKPIKQAAVPGQVVAYEGVKSAGEHR